MGEPKGVLAASKFTEAMPSEPARLRLVPGGAESAPSGRIGRVSGRALRVVFAGAVVVPPALGLVADRAGWRAAWLGACALAALAALSMSAAVLAQARDRGLQSSDLLRSREAT